MPASAIANVRPDEDLDLHIGAKLRHARKLQGLRLRDLADAVGCSESLISKIENEKVIPSLQMLHRIVTMLGTSIGAMFANGNTDPDPIMHPGQRPILSVDTIGRHDGKGIRLECLIPSGQLLYASIHIVDPGGTSGGTITHAGEEVGYVLEGRLEITIGNRSYQIEEGDSFFFPSDLPHGYWNPGTEVARILWVNTPSTF